MSSFKRIWGIGLLALLLITIVPAKSKAQDISSQDFYDSLAPYGTWVNDPQYGDVWVPDAEDDFMPYGTQGHWVLTEYGNTWVSNYPWGWATFHYGRWHYDDYYGWEWIPGYEWAPAWVSWREGGGYYGWAPLMPGISLSIAFGSGYHVPNRYWVCAPQAYINSPNIRNYYVPQTRMTTIIRNTTIINNTYVGGGRKYIAGPRAADIQRVTHQRPVVYNINNSNSPGGGNIHNNALTLYRPAVRKAPDARPERVVDGAAYRQQNPNQGIAHAVKGGGAVFNHANASKLASVARSSAPDNKVVRVNQPNNNQAQPGNRPNTPQSNTAPGQPANNPGNRQHNHQGQPGGVPATPQANPAQGQRAAAPDNRQHNQPAAATPATPQGQPATNQQNHRGRPENRPNIAPANPASQPDAQAQQQQQQNAQQQAQQQQRQQQNAQQQAQQQQRQQQNAQQQAQQQQRQQQNAQQQAQQQQRQQQAQQQQRQQQNAQQQAQQQQRQQQNAQQQAQQQQRQQPPQQQGQPQQQRQQQQQQRQQQQRPQPQPKQTPPPPPPAEQKPPGA